ncbi:MAG: hypothetical protein GX838_07125, partial [Clostridiaceae bacterium]|nr:hypothetical protein [Clostridiaceae bacterium]
AVETSNFEVVADNANRLIFTATEQNGATDTSAMGAYSALWDEVERRIDGEIVNPSIPFSQRRLDSSGLVNPRGEITVIGGTEGLGKTTWVLSAEYYVLKAGYGIAHFSLEMRKRELIASFASMCSGVPKPQLLLRRLSSGNWDKFVSAASTIKDFKLNIIDEYFSLTPSQLRRRLRKMIVSENQQVDLVVIDGLWLMKDDPETFINPRTGDVVVSRASRERHEEVFEITRKLNEIAFEFNIHIWITHQFNTNLLNRKNKKPLITDFAESAGVRRNAQNMIGLQRLDGSGITRAHILKLRNQNSAAIGMEIDYFYNADHSMVVESGDKVASHE